MAERTPPRLLLFLLSLLQIVSAKIFCLVERPGYGIVSEECPRSSVGCRIKWSPSGLHWSPVSRLYDRHQMVCVLPMEYTTDHGCVKKSYGLRCWCKSSVCNDEENSMRIVNQFRRQEEDAEEDHIGEREIEEREETMIAIPSTPSSPTTTTSTTASSSTSSFSPSRPPLSSLRPTRRIGMTPAPSTRDWRQLLEDEYEQSEEDEDISEVVDGIHARGTRRTEDDTGLWENLSGGIFLLPAVAFTLSLLPNLFDWS